MTEQNGKPEVYLGGTGMLKKRLHLFVPLMEEVNNKKCKLMPLKIDCRQFLDKMLLQRSQGVGLK